jgi:two-component system sensor histidine kinase HydH
MEKNIKVHIDLSSDIQAFKFDNGKLSQALLNIYLNAVDAMSEEGSLSITTKTTTENKMAEIVVEDNGCGIDEKDFPYIFNPFFTKKSYGTGLGLTQVKKIIDLHQGTLEIFSQPEKGTRVVITLPVAA